MKKIKRVLLFVILLFLIAICSENTVKAESYLYLNNLDFEVRVNEDASINITEYWNIEIEETNTLYKTFEIYNTEHLEITDVKVTEITNNANKEFIMQSNWEYHVDEGKYYGTKNEEGNFEIGWGTGLEYDYDTRSYKIEYKIQNAVAKYNDYAELYWQAIGKDFGIQAEKVTGEILLPAIANSKEDIKVWGHIENLNGIIYVEDLNKIEFQVDGNRSNTMLEIRTLFPTEMVTSSARTSNIERLQTVIDEETKWVEEANARREARVKNYSTVIAIMGIIFDIIFIITILRANKNPIRHQEKFVPEQDMEYFRDIPRKDATPGEAVQMLHKSTTKELNYDYLGKIFSAVLLNLKLKGYLEFEIDETKKEKEKISIRLENKSNVEELNSEEKDVYEFLDKVISKKQERVLTLKELQKAIKSNPAKVEKMGKGMGENIYSSLVLKELLDEKQAKEHTNSIAVLILQIIILIFFPVIASIVLGVEEIAFNSVIKYTFVTTSILGIISIAEKIRIIRKANPFTQKGVNEIEAWKGLKKYMEDFSLLNEREVPDIEIWERFLVYATAFGTADKVIKQLKLAYPNLEQITGNNYTMMYLMMNTDFNSSFSSAISTSMSSTYSSATGGGGGFSGGGGGGIGRRRRRRTLNLSKKLKLKIE